MKVVSIETQDKIERPYPYERLLESIRQVTGMCPACRAGTGLYAKLFFGVTQTQPQQYFLVLSCECSNCRKEAEVTFSLEKEPTAQLVESLLQMKMRTKRS